MFRPLLLYPQGEFYCMLKLLLRFLTADLKLYCTWVYKSIYNYLKNRIWFNVRLKMLKHPV